MRFSLLIGSQARGDNDINSDYDVVIIDGNEELFDSNLLRVPNGSHVDFIVYDADTFNKLFSAGSLFIYHIFFEGILLSGSPEEWERLKSEFLVQQNYASELEEIAKNTRLLAETPIFGDKFLTPLANAFTELKNACIFYLAHHGVFCFNKNKSLDEVMGRLNYTGNYISLKSFYDFSVRGLDIQLPFNPNDKTESAPLLMGTNNMVMEMYRACNQ